MTINPLVAGRIDGPKDAWAGVWLAEDIELIKQGIDNHSWVDGTIGVVGAGLDALALVSDPAGVLLQYGISNACASVTEDRTHGGSSPPNVECVRPGR